MENNSHHSFISQQNLPNLWNIFQLCIGGTIEKRELASKKLEREHKRVLEVGCSVGNLSKVFIFKPNISYTGIDIDKKAIRSAQARYRRCRNARFFCEEVNEFSNRGEQFDYLLYAGVFPHCDDKTSLSLLSAAKKLSHSDTDIIIQQPLIPESFDTCFMKQYIRLEQGQNLKSEAEMKKFIQSIPFFKLIDFEIHYISPFPFFSSLICARYVLARCRIM